MAEVSELEGLIEGYRLGLAQGLDVEDPHVEALLVLLDREELEDHWPELSEAQKEQVRRLDDLLLAKRMMVAVALPNPNFTDRRRWWWFLHEGPQVRSEALAAMPER